MFLDRIAPPRGSYIDGWMVFPNSISMQTTEDTLLGGRVKVLQPKKGYRVAIDPVMLAAAVPARAGDHVLDLGSGTGAASFCLKARSPDCRITGIENNPEYLDLSLQSCARNGWEGNPIFLPGDITSPPPGLEEDGYDFVMANPPYFDEKSYSPSPDVGKSSSNASPGGLGPWIDCASRYLRPRGAFFLICPAEGSDEVLALLSPVFREIGIIRLYARARAEAIRLVISAKKTGFLRFFEAGSLILHDEEGEFTPEARKILWDADAIALP